MNRRDIDMGDVGDDFKALKEHKKLKRQSNTIYSTDKLDELGIKYESKNDGAHLVVEGTYSKIDFWPSTGKFYIRKAKGYARGINNLIKHCSIED
ncbi:unnamed protein product [marine sediment metagenome]|uniref:Uncharacterized protein n=1 Tax=marine sediment metagenome TaxID=412755 RepID=X0Z2I2_9ZZZZ